MKRKIILLIVLLILMLAGPVYAMHSDNYQIDWMVPLTSAGSRQTSSTNYTAYVTVGQTVIGNSSSTRQNISLGFWQPNLTPTIRIYLPVLMKPTP